MMSEKSNCNFSEDARRHSQQPEINRLQNNYDLNTKMTDINDLKLEIISLEKKIANLKAQGNNGKFGDEAIINELEKEFQELKSKLLYFKFKNLT